jgi:hypothetical protein
VPLRGSCLQFVTNRRFSNLRSVGRLEHPSHSGAVFGQFDFYQLSRSTELDLVFQQLDGSRLDLATERTAFRQPGGNFEFDDKFEPGASFKRLFQEGWYRRERFFSRRWRRGCSAGDLQDQRTRWV